MNSDESMLSMICAYPHHALLSNHILLLMLLRPERQGEQQSAWMDEGPFDENFFTRALQQVDKKSPPLAREFHLRLDVFRLGAGSLAPHQNYFRAVFQVLASEMPKQGGDAEVRTNAVAVEEFLNYLEEEGLSKTSRPCPKELVQLLTRIAGKGPSNSMYDPSCATGRLLGGLASNADNHPARYVSGLGQSVNETDIFHAQLRAFGTNGALLIEKADAFRFPPTAGDQLRKFDIVVSDLSDGVDEWPQDICEDDPFGRFRFGLPSPAKGELALVQHMVATMHSHDGVAMAVVDQSVLMRSGKDAEIRKALIESNLLDAVIFLPQKLYRSDARSAVVLVFKAMRADTGVLIINGTRDFIPGKSLNKLTDDGVQIISENFASRTSAADQAVLISSDEFKVNDYVVSLSRYFSAQSETAELDLDSLNQSRKAMEQELLETSSAIDSLMDSLSTRR